MDGFSDFWYDHLQKNQCSDFFTCKNHSLEWQNWLKLLNIITLSRLQNEIQHQTLLRYIYQRGDCHNIECYNISTELWKAPGLWLCPHIQNLSASTTIKKELAALALCTCVRFTGLQRWVEIEVMSMLTMLEDRPILHHSQCLCIPVLCTDCNLIARQLMYFLSLPCIASPSSGCKDVSLA